MGSSRAIKAILKEKGVTARQLSRNIHMSEGTLSKKFRKDDFLESELKLIAEALGMKHTSYFEQC